MLRLTTALLCALPSLRLLAAECTAPAGYATHSESLLEADVVVLGEYHGTAEIPGFFYNFVCSALAEVTEPVVIALELPVEFNPVLDSIGVAQSEQVMRQIGAHAFWDKFNDGRSSAQMYRLLEQLVALAGKRPGTRLVAVASAQTDADGAKLVHDALRKDKARLAIVLIGNAHARLLPMPGFQSTPFAALLSGEYELDVVSLNISAGGGHGWLCTRNGPDSPVECLATAVFPQTAPAGISISPCKENCVYNGTFHLENISVGTALSR